MDLRSNLCDSGIRGASRQCRYFTATTLATDAKLPNNMGLGIARPPAINERPRAIGGPLERSLRSSDEKLRQLGSATVVVSIRRWIGKR